MRHNCATQVLTQTHNILKAGDLCHHALMMCWSVRNKKGSRTLSTWTQIQTAHTKLSTSSLCVFEATQTLWGFFPPLLVCNQHLLIRISYLKKKKPETPWSRQLTLPEIKCASSVGGCRAWNADAVSVFQTQFNHPDKQPRQTPDTYLLNRLRCKYLLILCGDVM